MREGRYSTKSKVKAKNDKKSGVILIMLLLIFLTAIVIFAINQSGTIQRAAVRFVDMPPVETILLSQDGSTHRFGARVVLEVTNETQDLNEDLLHREVTAAISKLSFDDITGFDGTDIIREAVRERLAENLGVDGLVAVYLPEIMGELPLQSMPQTSQPPRRNTIFDAIFGNGN